MPACCRAVLSRSLTNTLIIGALRHRARPRARRAARLLPRPPADPGKVAASWRWPPCRWCCLPSSRPMRSCCCSAVPASSRSFCATVGIPFSSIYGVERHRPRLHPDALPLMCFFPPLAALQGGRRLDRGGGAESRLLARAHLLHGHRCRSCCRRCWPARLLVFIETIENFGVPFVLAEDMPILAVEAYKLFIGETGGNPASAGVLGVLLILCTTLVLLIQRHYLSAAAASRPRRARRRRSAGDRPRLAAAGHHLLLGDRAAGARAVLRHRRDVLHGVPRPGAASALQPGQLPRPLFGRSWRPLINTLVFATAAAFVRGPRSACRSAIVVTRFRVQASPTCSTSSPCCLSPSPAPCSASASSSPSTAGWLVLTGGWLILVLAYVVREDPVQRARLGRASSTRSIPASRRHRSISASRRCRPSCASPCR